MKSPTDAALVRHRALKRVITHILDATASAQNCSRRFVFKDNVAIAACAPGARVGLSRIKLTVIYHGKTPSVFTLFQRKIVLFRVVGICQLRIASETRIHIVARLLPNALRCKSRATLWHSEASSRPLKAHVRQLPTYGTLFTKFSSEILLALSVYIKGYNPL